jgi:hypothetical protein
MPPPPPPPVALAAAAAAAAIMSRRVRSIRSRSSPNVGLSLTPGGCQIGYMDHTGCHQRVLTAT